MGQRTPGRHLRLAAVRGREHRREGEIADTVLFHVGPSVDRDHARRRLGGSGVDPQDFCMGMRRTDEDHMGLVRPRQVVGESTGSRQETVVLDTLDVLSLAKHRHTPLPPRIPIGSAGL